MLYKLKKIMFSQSSTSIGKRVLAILLLALFVFFSFALATTSVTAVFQCNCADCSCTPAECNCESEVEEQTLLDCLINCFNLIVFERTDCITANMVSEAMALLSTDEAISYNYSLFIEQPTPITSKIRMNN